MAAGVWTMQVPAWAALGAAAAAQLAGAPGAVALAGGLAAAAATAWGTRSASEPEPVPSAATATATVVPAPRRAPARAARPTGAGTERAVRDVAALSAASTEVAQRFASVADALQELRRASDEVTTGSGQAREGARAARERAAEAGQRVSSLLEASQEIGDITGVIASITDQTRTLALNATIEAARAGSAGRGFAVVADQVKELAGATSRAAQSIARQVTSVQEGTRSAAEALEGVSTVLADLDRVQDEVGQAVSRQAEAGSAIGSDVDEASRGSARMAELVAARVEAEQRTFVESALGLGRALLEEAGGLRTGSGTTTWTVSDALGRTARHELPALLLGDAPLARNDDPSRPSPVVDEVVRLVGGSATLFQRLDDGGMLRVATTVVGPDGRRAVGTALSPTAPDGGPNPVLRSVLGGSTYVGEALVLGTPCFTAYAPLHDDDGRVLGMLYVGMPRLTT